MKFKDWAASGGKFHLSGGPFDGVSLDAATSAVGGWPSEIVHEGHVYTMRIGDLDHYDYDGPAAEPPHAE